MTEDFQHSQAPTIRQVMPAPSPTAQALKGMDPEAMLANMPIDLVNTIVSEWRAARSAPGIAAAGESSVTQYSINTERLERKYSEENNVEYGLLSPVDFVKSLFFHAQDLSAASWNLYRHGVLHIMNARALEMDAKGHPQKSLMTAIAALIVATKKPGSVETTAAALRKPKPGHPKSISSKYFTELVTHLAVGFDAVNLSARRAQSFAMATLATGMRPVEWKSAILRQPTAAEMENLSSKDDWLAIDVVTGKRKENEEEWVRTLLIPPGQYQIHIRQHFDSFHSYVFQSKARNIQPEKLYIRHCSAMMTTACQQLWPKHPDRRFTLMTLRSQARANFASIHGGHIAAAMLGHSPETSMSYYAGKQRANLSKRGTAIKHGDIPVPVPGKNVLLKAEEFMRRARVLAQQSAPAPTPEEDINAEMS